MSSLHAMESSPSTPTEACSRGRSSAVAGTPITTPSTTRSSSNSSRPKIYRCDYEGCTNVYSRPSSLTQHQRSHTNTRPFNCDVCEDKFFRESHLKRHMLKHTQEKPYTCAVCGKGVNTLQHLKRHEITHTKSFKCDYEDCEEAFYKHQQLRHHTASVHLKTLTCKDCGKTFPRPYRLANHMQKHHGASPAYQCDFPGCLNSFKTWSALQLHMKTEHFKLMCQICGRGCVGQEGLRMHMVVHDEERVPKNWKCTECPKEFARKEELMRHSEERHLFIPHVLQSQVRDENLNTQRVERIISNGGSSLAILLNSVSAPEKTIPCTFKNCTRAFKKDYDLQRHLQWHEKQREEFAVKGLLMVSGTSKDEMELANQIINSRGS